MGKSVEMETGREKDRKGQGRIESTFLKIEFLKIELLKIGCPERAGMKEHTLYL
jgi:hypothetical protein